MASLGDNITALAVRGSFDDCQRLVKQAFADDDLRKHVWLTPANSINLGRLLPQVSYYFVLAGLAHERQPLIVSVPSGNFGNLTAGLMARRIGLPVRRWVAATNVNDVVPTYLRSGQYRPRASVRTVANAMDVGDPSNFERIRSMYAGDLEALRLDLSGAAFDDERVIAEIGEVYRRHDYLLDPHGAIAWLGLTDALANDPDATGVFLATAHPAKFREVVEPAIRTSLPLPSMLAGGDCPSSSPDVHGCRVQRPRGVAARMTGPPAETFRPVARELPPREAIPASYRWDLSAICRDWDDWSRSYDELERGIEAFAALKGTLASGAEALMAAFRAMDATGALSYRVWYFASLHYDQDQRDNDANARRPQVQILFARLQQAGAWFNPELLSIPRDEVRRWLDTSSALAVYRFAIESLFHEQEHVLDERGERLMSFASRYDSAPHDSYAALTTADMQSPSIALASGERVTLTYGQYRALLETNRRQEDREAAYRAFNGAYAQHQNTYAALYNAVLQRDWFHARARGYASTLEAALHGNSIPTSVVDNLISVTKAGVEPLRRYHQLRRRVLGLDTYRLFDVFVPLVDHRAHYRYDEVGRWIVDSVAPLGRAYQEDVETALAGGWIDVFENKGKRSGAYSAPVYGSHPFMLLNYNETLDAVFTLAHEMGHSMHTVLSHQAQPFVYAGYTIFVAEVPSTLSEALFLDLMLDRATNRDERIVLLQHAIDSIASTFYAQVLFADFELAGASSRRARSAGDSRGAEHDLRDAAARVLRRCSRRRRTVSGHVGAHPAFFSARRTTSTNTRPALPQRRC